MNVELLTAELERDEELRLKPYRDSLGNLSIGIGRNLDDEGISRHEALMMLANDIDKRVRLLDEHLPWWRSLDEVRSRVIVNMCFNLGIGGLLGFRRMLAALKAGDYDTAADEMADSKWARQVGDRAVRLVAMMRAGQADEPEGA